MALGGGVWTTQNKKLPGAYINFVSVANASAELSERGYAAMPLVLDWGAEGKVVTVTEEDFIKNSQKIFGYEYTNAKLMGLRDLFKNLQVLYLYKLNTGVKAANTYATAKYGGIRGNDIKIVISANADNTSNYDVKTYLGTTLVDTQTVAGSAALISNDYVDFISSVELAVTAATPLTGGTNGEDVTGTDWQTALTKLESYSFNILGVVSTTELIKALCIAYTKRMRDQVGVKFQCVCYKPTAPDDKGIIGVDNTINGETVETGNLVYWVTGAEASCKVNKSIMNKVYDGEYDVNTDYSQIELEQAIDSGKFVFHSVNGVVRVLEDINTKTTVTDDEGEDFKANQTMRVCDQIGNDIAVIFNTECLGVWPNDTPGRVSLWNKITSHHEELQTLRAIENFDTADVTVTKGNTKDSVVVTDAITVVNAMGKLYMTVKVA